MALEDAINNLAAAINRFADLQGAAPKAEAPKEVKKSPPKEAGAPTAEPTETTTTSTAPSEKETPSEAEAPKVEPMNVTEEFLTKANDLIQLDIEKAKAVLTELGYPKFKLVPANLHAKGLKLIEAQLNG